MMTAEKRVRVVMFLYIVISLVWFDSCIVKGARYIGTTSDDARQILDDSQGTKAFGISTKGHPRAHAPNPNDGSVKNKIDCVETYSKGQIGKYAKSAFLSRQEQNEVANWALQLQAAQDAMNTLNNDHNLKKFVLVIENPASTSEGQIWDNGTQRGDPQVFHKMTIELAHRDGQQTNPSANVQVQSFYPDL